MSERKEFELWAAFDLMQHDFERGEHGEYLDDFLQQSWLGWQAARTITPAMIEAGAQRLVRWDENSVWPDSWSAMDVAAARHDAERVLRSALSVATGADDHE